MKLCNEMRSLWNKVKRVKEEDFKGKALNDTEKIR